MLASLDSFPVTSLENLIISAFFFSTYIKIDHARSQKKPQTQNLLNRF